jgi:MFS family permease
MFEEAAGLALVAGFYPPAMLIAAVYLVSARPGRMVVLYVTGGILMVTVIGTIVLVLIRAGGLSHFGQHQTRYGLRLGLGILALIAAVVIARRTPKPPDQADPAKPKKPSLVARMSAEPKPLKAFVVGVLIFGPSLSFVAAVQVVATAKASLAATIGAMAMIIILTVMFAWAPLVAYLIAPDKTVRALRSFDDWLRRHGKVILVVATAVIGVALVIQGITGLT